MNKQDNARADAMFAEYARGFMAKCAEAGVDPYYAGQMFAVKVAQQPSNPTDVLKAREIARMKELARQARNSPNAQTVTQELPGGRKVVRTSAYIAPDGSVQAAPGADSGVQSALPPASASTRATAPVAPVTSTPAPTPSPAPVAPAPAPAPAHVAAAPVTAQPAPAVAATAARPNLRLKPNSKSVNQTIVGRRL